MSNQVHRSALQGMEEGFPQSEEGNWDWGCGLGGLVMGGRGSKGIGDNEHHRNLMQGGGWGVGDGEWGLGGLAGGLWLGLV